MWPIRNKMECDMIKIRHCLWGYQIFGKCQIFGKHQIFGEVSFWVRFWVHEGVFASFLLVVCESAKYLGNAKCLVKLYSDHQIFWKCQIFGEASFWPPNIWEMPNIWWSFILTAKYLGNAKYLMKFHSERDFGCMWLCLSHVSGVENFSSSGMSEVLLTSAILTGEILQNNNSQIL